MSPSVLLELTTQLNSQVQTFRADQQIFSFPCQGRRIALVHLFYFLFLYHLQSASSSLGIFLGNVHQVFVHEIVPEVSGLSRLLSLVSIVDSVMNFNCFINFFSSKKQSV